MQTSESCALVCLLRTLRKIEPDRAREIATPRSDVAAAWIESISREARLPEAEAQAYVEAARFLVSGRHLRACARCQIQILTPNEAGSCPHCKSPQQRGVLAAPRTIEVHPTLERRLRRMILDSTARRRTQAQVAEARKLREAGSIGTRPEAEVVPQEKSCAESVLGSYRLLGLVGRGSSSWVYRAENTRNGRPVALKVFYVEEKTPAATVEERMARFRREAELAGSLEHPHLVPVGPLEQAASWYFMSMPFIDGPSLAHVLEARAAGSEAQDGSPLLIALADVARGLHYAHCRGVVHRDVSPRNVLFDRAGHAYLTDFGAAKSLDAASNLTAARTVVGTIAYAAPERLQSESKADARSDVYSLGVVLYEILTGRTPYREHQVAPLLTKILKEGPPAPRSIRSDVAADLEALALRAMDADPARRPASALAFAEALTTCVEGGGAGEAAADPGVGSAGFEGVASLGARARAFALGAVAVALIFLLGASLGRGSGPVADRGPVESAYRNWSASRGAAQSNAREVLDRALAALEQAPVRDESALRAWKAGVAWADGRTAAAVDLLTGVSPSADLRSDALRVHGLAAYFLAGRYGSGPRADRLLGMVRSDFAALAESGETYDRSLAEAVLLLLGNDLDGAFTRFHDLARDHPERREPALLEAWTALLGQASSVAEVAANALAQQSPRDPWALLLHGLCLHAKGEAAAALGIARRLRSDRPHMAEGAILQSQAAWSAGNLVEAAAAAQAAIELDPAAPGPHRILAGIAEAQGDLCAATAALARAVRLDPDHEAPTFRLASLLARHGNLTRARECADEYLRRFPQGEFAGAARDLSTGE